MNDLTVNVNKVIPAPIVKVFAAWLDPKTLAQFMLPMPNMAEPEIDNDPREGGSFTIVMQVGENKIPHTGKYLEIDPPKKLVFSWNSPASTDNSTVSLSFTELDQATTKVELTHIRFIDEAHRSNHEGGWNHILTKLSEIMA